MSAVISRNDRQESESEQRSNRTHEKCVRGSTKGKSVYRCGNKCKYAHIDVDIDVDPEVGVDACICLNAEALTPLHHQTEHRQNFSQASKQKVGQHLPLKQSNRKKWQRFPS